MLVASQKIKRFLYGLLAFLMLILILLIIFNLFILLLPLIIIIGLVSYLLGKFRGKRNKPRDYIDVSFKVKE